MRKMRAIMILAMLVGVCACVPAGRLQPARGAPEAFDVGAFFAGRTAGRGVLKVAARRKEMVVVDGRGRIDADGVIVLDQLVRRGDRPAQARQWRLHSDGAGRYAGTLSDAVGPVAGEVNGNVFHLRFGLKGGLRAHQWLALQPGGAVRNVMIIRKFGVPVARLDETIVRVPG